MWPPGELIEQDFWVPILVAKLGPWVGLTHCISNEISGVADAAGLRNTWDKSGLSQSAHSTYATNLGKIQDHVPPPPPPESKEEDWDARLSAWLVSLCLMDRSIKPLSPTDPGNRPAIMKQQ